MNKILLPIKNELETFENKLKEVISKEDNFLINDLNNFIFSNPKRLRPIFIFLLSKILKIENTLVLNIALITELIHNASLIHDDIIDEEKTRRNHPTFFEKYGSKLAVLEGDLVLSLALEKISETNLQISKIFSQKIKNTINGEIIQNENISKITDLETYYQKTLNKTGNLFLAGLEALFTLEDVDEETKKSLNAFLKNYTLAFQIKNDIDNFKIDSTDFKNGNYTLPVIYFFMENKTASFNQTQIDFEKYIEQAKQTTKDFKQKALKNLDNIENSIYKNSLIKLTDFTLRS
ncbi:polyprenyl synthetase family protein [bacterium]|nr:polyprenyl synthetase family protein [bacterium]